MQFPVLHLPHAGLLTPFIAGLLQQDATELVAKLRAYHHTAQTNADKKHLGHFGLELVEGKVGGEPASITRACWPALFLGSACPRRCVGSPWPK